MNREGRHIKKKSRGPRIAGCLSVLLALACVVIGVGYFVLHKESATPSPSPEPIGIGMILDKQYEGSYPVVDWEYWKEQNSDMVAWVTVPDTTIDHPICVAQKSWPGFYLDHNAKGDWSIWGSPYIDADCPDGLDSKHCIILGHHMDDGSMFSDFVKYYDSAWAKEHETIYLQTPERCVKLRVFAVDVINNKGAEKYVSFTGDSAFQYWVRQTISQADVVYDADVEPDQVITFLTCTYSYENPSRTLVYCVLDEVVEEF